MLESTIWCQQDQERIPKYFELPVLLHKCIKIGESAHKCSISRQGCSAVPEVDRPPAGRHHEHSEEVRRHADESSMQRGLHIDNQHIGRVPSLQIGVVKSWHLENDLKSCR